MAPHRRRSRAAATTLTAVLALAGCESPVPFYRPGEGSPDDPVVGLSGPAPYVPARRTGEGRGGPAASAAQDPGVLTSETSGGPVGPRAPVLPARLYVPDGRGVYVIEPGRFRVVGRIAVAASRVVPSWDLRRLWALVGGALVPLEGTKPGVPVRTAASGLYFTPDGRDALVLGRRRLEVGDPQSMRLRASIPLPCAAEYADFSHDGAFLAASCARRLVRVDVIRRRVTGTLALPMGTRAGDLRLSPDGTVFYVADAIRGGVWLVDAARFTRVGFVRTGAGARWLAAGRAALFVVGAGSVSLVDFRTRRVTARWALPGSPVLGGISGNGSRLWLADSASRLVYALSAQTGKVLGKVRVHGRPLTVCVPPQPGHISVGGTGLYR